MFVTRKLYDLGNGKKAASYEITDDYRNVVQLTPGEVQTLYQYLASKSTQIVNDVNGDVVDDLAARWKQPNTSTVYLHNGETIETEVNGRDFDGKSGSILLNGKPTDVVLEDGQWKEA